MTHLTDEFLFKELTGELTAEESREMKLHLGQCAECRMLHENYAAADRMFRNIGTPEVSQDFTSAVMEKIKPSVIKSGVSSGRFVTYVSLVFVTLFSVLAGFIISALDTGKKEGGSLLESVDFSGYYGKLTEVFTSQSFQVVSMVLFFGFALILFFTYEKFRKLKSY